MPVNPNIALGVQPIQLADPMAQYGKMIAIQNAQNQNALNQYQLGAAQRGEAREVAKMNALAQAGTDETAVANALLKSGDLTGYSAFVKAAEDRRTQKLTQQKTEAELFDASMKQIRNFWGNVRTPEEAMAIHDATHKDPIINKRLQALGITEQMGRQQIMDAAKDPASFATFVKRAQLGAEKFMEMNKPQLSTKDVGATLEDRTFEPLTGKITTVGTTPKTATIGERTAQGQLNLAQQRFAFEKANPGFELKEGEDGTFYGVNKRTLQATPVTIGAAPAATGTAPVAATPLKGKGKDTALTESQGNATAFGMRMQEANKILTDLEGSGEKDTGLIKGVVGGTVGLIPFIGDKLENVSGSIFNALPQVLGGLSPAQQKVAQARINFITALLRKESGAAIGASEFATAEKNYFPQPGEGADVIKQKQQARETAIKAMQIQAGPGARQMGGNAPSASAVPGASANDPLGLGTGGR